MKKILATALLVLPVAGFAAGSAAADHPVKRHRHRTSLLGQCSKQAHAKGLHGPARRKFISGCISAAKRAKRTRTDAEAGTGVETDGGSAA